MKQSRRYFPLLSPSPPPNPSPFAYSEATIDMLDAESEIAISRQFFSTSVTFAYTVAINQCRAAHYKCIF